MTFRNTDVLARHSGAKKAYKNESLHFVCLLASVSQDVRRGTIPTKIYFEEMSTSRRMGVLLPSNEKKCVKINIPPDVDINMKSIFLMLLFHI